MSFFRAGVAALTILCVVPYGRAQTPVASEVNTAQGPPIEMDVQTTPFRVSAGQSVTLTLRIKDPQSGKPVLFDQPTLNSIPPVRMFIVRSDAYEVTPLYPVWQKDGTWTQNATFSTGGDWHLVVEATPPNTSEPQVRETTVSVEGAHEVAVPMKPQSSLKATSNDYAVESRFGNVHTGRLTRFRVTLTDNRRQTQTTAAPTAANLPTLPPYELLFVGANGDLWTRARTEPATPNGLSFIVRFPKAGVYKGWLTLRRPDRSEAVFPFALRVTDPQ